MGSVCLFVPCFGRVVVVTNVESDGTDDTVVFTERDSSFCVDITTTKDGKFVTVNSNSRTSSEELNLFQTFQLRFLFSVSVTL